MNCYLTTLSSLNGDNDSVVVRNSVREVGVRTKKEKKKKKRERGEYISPCTRDSQFITTDLPRQFDAAPTLDERRHMSIAAAENAG